MDPFDLWGAPISDAVRQGQFIEGAADPDIQSLRNLTSGGLSLREVPDVLEHTPVDLRDDGLRPQLPVR